MSQNDMIDLREDNEQLRIALAFCLEIAAEAYPDVRHNLAAECALRHIKRKASEALKRAEDGR